MIQKKQSWVISVFFRSDLTLHKENAKEEYNLGQSSQCLVYKTHNHSVGLTTLVDKLRIMNLVSIKSNGWRQLSYISSFLIWKFRRWRRLGSSRGSASSSFLTVKKTRMTKCLSVPPLERAESHVNCQEFRFALLWVSCQKCNSCY